VLAVSHSIRTLAVCEGLCPADKVEVLLGGSVNAVDAGRFKPPGEHARRAARTERGIPANATVIGFVGRLARDKGIVELGEAWRRLRGDRRLHLLLVGPEDATDPVPADVVADLRADPHVHFTGLDPDTPRLYAAMDVLALPTYREGFPQVALEAAAMGLPVVATSVSGCVDAVHDGLTGTLVPPRDVGALAGALQRYASDPSLRARHGEAARRRILREFRQDLMWEALAAEYRRLLALRRRPPGRTRPA
jgi:glycosyltransferase involved in cell wall biosynthesis